MPLVTYVINNIAVMSIVCGCGSRTGVRHAVSAVARSHTARLDGAIYLTGNTREQHARTDPLIIHRALSAARDGLPARIPEPEAPLEDGAGV